MTDSPTAAPTPTARVTAHWTFEILIIVMILCVLLSFVVNYRRAYSLRKRHLYLKRKKEELIAKGMYDEAEAVKDHPSYTGELYEQMASGLHTSGAGHWIGYTTQHSLIARTFEGGFLKFKSLMDTAMAIFMGSLMADSLRQVVKDSFSPAKAQNAALVVGLVIFLMYSLLSDQSGYAIQENMGGTTDLVPPDNEESDEEDDLKAHHEN